MNYNKSLPQKGKNIFSDQNREGLGNTGEILDQNREKLTNLDQEQKIRLASNYKRVREAQNFFNLRRGTVQANEK